MRGSSPILLCCGTFGLIHQQSRSCDHLGPCISVISKLRLLSGRRRVVAAYKQLDLALRHGIHTTLDRTYIFMVTQNKADSFSQLPNHLS